MEQELVEKLQAHYGADPSPIERKHLDFALSNRTRARKVIDRVVEKTGIDLRGKRVLDVGSAYGGFVIEAAARGAEAWGVEINARLHEYGKANARGEPGTIHQVHADFLSRKVLDALPRDFDVVLINDVFEHVYDTAALLKQLHTLMRDGAPFMFAIPNADALKHVANEGHNLTPGISQLAPNWWHFFVPSYTAFYRPWSHYTALFRGFGFERIDTWFGRRLELEEARAEIKAGLERALASVATLSLDRQTRPVLEAAMAEYRARLEADLAAGDVDLLKWRYLTNFWKGCAYKGGPITADVAERPTRKRRPREPAPTPTVAGVKAKLARYARTFTEAVAARARSTPRPAINGQLASIPLARADRELQSRWCLRTDTRVTTTNGVIRCEVTAGDADDAGAGRYGGVRLPVGSSSRVRIELELFGTEHIEAVYIDGEDGNRGRHLRWRWTRPHGRGPLRAIHDLAAGEDSELFRSELPTTPDQVSELHVFLRVANGARAGFVIHRVEAG